MAKKNKLPIVKDPNCLNCGYPFNQNEKFCPECGQKNKGSKVTFGSFMREMFSGFFSWDAKFWRTLFPLLIKPGKVSKDYINGKRNKYTNPFRFYLATSIIFFILIGLKENYKKYQTLRSEKSMPSSELAIDIGQGNKKAPLQDEVIKQLDNTNKLIDSIEKTNIPKDSISTDTINHNFINYDRSFIDGEKLQKFITFNKDNPNTDIDVALDSLKMKKNFSNRFWYSRSKIINGFMTNKNEAKKFTQKMVSYTSIALFMLLPIFTLSLKFLYIRRKFTYVEHLVFVFHIQTVFFLLLIIFTITSFFKVINSSQMLLTFLFLFLLYLFLAMKNFYKQKIIKTFIKFCFANFIFMLLTAFGIMAISTITFALY